MGCSAQDQIAGYKTINKKLRELNPNVDPIGLQFGINKYWLGLENNIMTDAEKDVYNTLVKQTEGIALINLGGTKQLQEQLVFVKDIGKEYVIHLESGKNYTFEKGKAQSNPTRAGRTVMMPAMELTKTYQNSVKGSDQNTQIGETEADKFIEQEVIDLGTTLTDKFMEMAEMNQESSGLKELRNKMKIIGEYEVKINEYNARNEEAPAKLMEDYNKTYDEAEAIQATLTEFEVLTSTVLNTYQVTMTNLGTGELKMQMFENANSQTAASIDLRTNEMKARWNKMSRITNLSEAFLHEINHKMSSHVFDANVQLTRLMKDLRDSAINSGVTYELFLDKIADPTEQEIEIAKMKFKYVFDKTADIEEFYAYATTNEQVYNAIKDVKISIPLIKDLEIDPSKPSSIKKVLNALIKTVNTIWTTLSGRGKRGGQLVAEMVTTIAKLDAEMMQQKMVDENEQPGVSSYARAKMNSIDELIEPVVKKVGDWSEKLSEAGPKDVSKQIAKIPVLNELMNTGITQYLWRAVTQDTTTEDVADMYAVFRHSKQVVEKHTADIRNGVKSVATEMFKDTDKTTKDAITKVVLSGDMAQFTASEIQEYLNEPAKIQEEIEKLTKIVHLGASKELVKSRDKQIDGLAEYLVSGKTVAHDQQINANNIAANMQIAHRVPKRKMPERPSKELIDTIDKIVSLKVLQKSDEVHTKAIKELVSNKDGVELLDKTINMYRGYIDNMRADATIDAHDPIPKGYTRPADGLLRYELIPEDEVKAQESVLMRLVNDKPYTIVEGKKYYLMTGRTKSVGFSEGAIGLISHTTEGIPLSSLIRKNNEMKGNKGLIDGELRAKTKQIVEAIRNSKNGRINKFAMIEGQTLVPVYNHRNEIVDYRIQLNNLEKEMYLPDRETEIEDILSNTFSRSIKTSLTATENKRVVDTIIENSGRGVLENPDDYVLVEEYTEEDKMNGVKREKRHDRWEYLPDHTKDYIYQRTSNKGILVHKDFVELMTGEKDVTIGNFAKFGFDMKQHPVAKARLMALEAYITEILSYVKQAMVVLNGDILVGNQVSNAMVAASHGINPVKYTKKFKQRWQQLNDYNEKVQMLSELEVKQMAGENVGLEIRQLKKQLEGNIWDELVKDGQYTALVEDVNIEAKLDGQIATMVQQQIDKSNFKGIIEGVRNGLYIDKTTALYQTMAKSVHYGDAITRQIIKEELEEKAIKREGELTEDVKKDILNYLDQLLVNYGYTMNRWWKYSERVGGLFFMRYYMGQAKAIMSMAKKSPTRTALLQGVQKVTGVDIADPIDTYTNSGIDGVTYRHMFTEAPYLLAEPNILDLIPDMSAAFVMR